MAEVNFPTTPKSDSGTVVFTKEPFGERKKSQRSGRKLSLLVSAVSVTMLPAIKMIYKVLAHAPVPCYRPIK